LKEKKMPLNVRRFCFSVFLGLISFAAVNYSQQQQQAVNQPSPVPSAAVPFKTETSGEVMRERISKAKAFIAVRNYNAAIYELEMLRRETSDSSVHAVTNILLMNSYLEQGNYIKAQAFLNDAYKNFKANNANGSMFYAAIAGQAVKGARNQIERYRGLGLAVSDRNLPLEAVNDIEKIRETLELVITQTKEVSANKAQAAVAMPILDEAIAARSSIGRDDYDAKRWRDAGADIREDIASSRSVVINAVDGTRESPASQQPVAPSQTDTATNLAANFQKPVEQPQTQQNLPPVETANKPLITRTVDSKPLNEPQTQKVNPAIVNQTADSSAKTPRMQPVANEVKSESQSSGQFDAGSLLAYATEKIAPVYPSAAKTMRAAGIVKVEVVLDENGQLAEVKNATGHSLLVAAAKDAIHKWKFRPVMRDGQAVRASGYVNFNFTL
jgi:periplasmic protein TonB